MSIGICGGRSAIAREFQLAVEDEKIHKADMLSMPLGFDRYLICSGFLAGERITLITPENAVLTWQQNFIRIAALCDRIFTVNDHARIVVLGSESGFSGSHDMAYAGAKAALHLYIETKQLSHPEQMLVGLAPHIIWDSGMTQRRSDLAELEERGRATRLGRWLTAEEVAHGAHHLLYGASPALSGQVIRMRAS